MNGWIENKGRKRAPYKKGTLIDVQYRDAGIEYGVVCGSGAAQDWEIDNVKGDILAYRPHQENKDGQE